MRIDPKKVELRADTDRGFIRYEIWWRGKQIGYANVNNFGAIVEIADLRIADLPAERREQLRTLKREWLLNIDGLIRALLWRVPSSRGCGLGTLLLRRIIEDAKRSGAKAIVGKLAPRDLEVWAELPKWYEKHGFEIVPDAKGWSRIERNL